MAADEGLHTEYPETAGWRWLLDQWRSHHWMGQRQGKPISISFSLSLWISEFTLFSLIVFIILQLYGFFGGWGGGEIMKISICNHVPYLNYENWFLYFTCNGIKSLEIYTAVEIKCFWLWIFQLKEGGKKSSFTGFNDSTLSDGRTIIDLIDCIRRGMINYDLVKDGASEEVSLSDQSSAH